MTTLQQMQEAAILNHPLYTVPGFKAGALFGIDWERDRDRWIKVEDQLPPVGFYNVIGIGLKHAYSDYFDGREWDSQLKVTHWQALPQLPKT